MKKKDLSKLKERTVKQLITQVGKDKLKLRQEMADFYGKSDKDPKKIRQLKKDIAQTLTILRQKEIEKETEVESKDVKKTK